MSVVRYDREGDVLASAIGCSIAKGTKLMTIGRTLVLCASALAASMSVSYAGPCSQQIDRLRAEIDAKLGALAAAGPSARETTAATMHRQPTPRSIEAAEDRLGDTVV